LAEGEFAWTKWGRSVTPCAGGTPVPTGGAGRLSRPGRCRYPPATPATPCRIAPVAREENTRSQPPI